MHQFSCAILDGENVMYQSTTRFSNEIELINVVEQHSKAIRSIYTELSLDFDIRWIVQELCENHFVCWDYVNKHYTVCMAIDNCPGYVANKGLEQVSWWPCVYDWKKIQSANNINFFRLLNRTSLRSTHGEI
jgi:hypothetical protein